jgi:electron transfer flavoprotein alpha subunit
VTESAPQRVWVFVEQEGGRAHGVSWELLGAAQRLARELANGVVEAVLLGHDIAPLAGDAIAYGASRVYVVDEPVLAKYRNMPYSRAIAQLVERFAPEIFLIGATTLGRDLASAIATRVKTGLTADCTELAIDRDKKILAATRPTFGGNLMATILCRTQRPQMATVRPRVLPMPERHSDAAGEIVRVPFGLREDEVAVKHVAFLPAEAQADIENAEIIVAGGRGAGGPEGFVLLQQLADTLGGVLGASRPAVDAGWINVAHQVGQTGKTVRPRLYIAAGISGAIQHRVGVTGSDCILAINSDPNAPIFGIADVGIVGDLFEVVPELIRQVKAVRA